MSSYLVCIDPGHGPGCANKSPDESYQEQEFAMDLARRLEAHLHRHGVAVILTRDEKGYPSLARRCKTANDRKNIGLFVSLHSNAAGSSGWSSARGHMIFTSAPGSTAGRNIAANMLLSHWKEAGINVRSPGLSHYGYTVLTGTTAPAMLLEHGFHTNKEDVAQLKTESYRQKLAKADAQGILDYLGIAWQEESKGDAAAPTENPGRSGCRPASAWQKKPWTIWSSTAMARSFWKSWRKTRGNKPPAGTKTTHK